MKLNKRAGQKSIDCQRIFKKIELATVLLIPGAQGTVGKKLAMEKVKLTRFHTEHFRQFLTKQNFYSLE